ncbi:MAG: DUF547 domain-containing protein [Coleofasciculus chthonoplastes F3-SA18-01]|uniref:DUF547 domain-containing protein n=1 Tax=Coleofasciculus chthonoplastes TaxID=64178 RepID=UPI0033032700
MIDFTLWDQLLRQYVDENGRINYQNWSQQSYQTMINWLKTVAQLDPNSLSNPDEQLALWINLYNASVIASVLTRYPMKSILPRIFGIPNWLAFLWFFIHPLPPNRRYSLNQIEHKILRREFNEPRIHFALVCAAIGCPLLRPGAYWAESVRTQLEEDASRFINNPDKVRYNQSNQTLYCSRIFKWYGDDFLNVADSIPDYIRTYLNTESAIASDTPIIYLDYDWTLNDQRISS